MKILLQNKAMLALLILSYITNIRGMQSESYSIHTVARRNRIAELTQLLVDNADANAVDEQGLTPLHVAASVGHQKVVAVLLAYNARVGAKTPAGKAAWELAEENGHDSIARMLRALASTDEGDEDSARSVNARQGAQAVGKARPVIVKGQIAPGAVSNTKNNKGHSSIQTAKKAFLVDDPAGYKALDSAIWEKKFDEVVRLLDQGADCNGKDDSGRTLLHSASEFGQSNVVQLLLSRGATISPDEFGHTPLHLASTVEVAKLLIEYGADVAAAHELGGGTPLHESKTGSIATLLLQRGAHVDCRDNNMKTPLHVSSVNEVVKVLLAHGADVHAHDDFENTPLHYAETSEIVEMLLQKGAQINAVDFYGWTPLHFAIETFSKNTNVHDRLGVLEKLIERGSNLQAVDQKGRTPLQLAEEKVTTAESESMAQELEKCVRLLKSAEKSTKSVPQKKTRDQQKAPIVSKTAHLVDLNAKDAEGKTSLHRAAEKGDQALVKQLLSQGADRNAKNNKGGTPLHGAAFNGYSEVCRMLLAAGADKQQQNKFGNTALHVASLQGHVGVCTVLIESEIDLAIENENGHTALQVAQRSQQKEVIALITQAQKKNNPQATVAVAKAAHAKVAKKVLPLNFDIYRKDAEGLTPLHRAARDGNLELAEQLLERGASVDVPEAKFQNTPLMLAANHGHLDVMRLLMSKKANIQDGNSFGYSPAHFAHANQKIDALKLLLESGFDVTIPYAYPNNARGSLLEFATIKAHEFDEPAVKDMLALIQSWVPKDKKKAAVLTKKLTSFPLLDPNKADYAGRTPLIQAAIDGDADKTEQLLAQKAQVYVKDKSEKRALDWAAELGNVKIAELLLTHGAEVNAFGGTHPPVPPLHGAAAYGHVGVVAVLLKYKADVRARDKYGRTALHHAAWCLKTGTAEQAEVVDILIKNGALVDAVCEDDPHTPLQMASIYGSTEVAKALIKHKADMTLEDSGGNTALHLAAKGGHKEIIALMLAQRVPVDILTPTKKTPLHLAAEHGKDEAAKALLEKKADVNAKDSTYGYYTPLHYAAEQGHAEVVKLLLSYGAKPNAKAIGKKSPIDLARNQLIKSLLTKK